MKTRSKNLRVVHKTLVLPSSLNLLTEATWEFAHRVLWDKFPFNEEEVKRCKEHIAQYYKKIAPEKFALTAHKHFAAFCERILLAKSYVDRFSSRYMPHPCLWFNPQNPKGFAGTKLWYIQKLRRREERLEAFHAFREDYALDAIYGQIQFRA